MKDKDDDEYYDQGAADVPCPCGQQLIGTLFGSILAYNALLLSGRANPTPVLVCMSFGITVGTICSGSPTMPATATATATLASLQGGSILFAVCMVVCHIVAYCVVGVDTLFGICMVAVATSTSAAAALNAWATFGVLWTWNCNHKALDATAYMKTCHV